MPTFKKEYSTLVEDIMTDCDIYSADGHKYHTERALWDTGARDNCSLYSVSSIVFTLEK